MIQKLFDKYVVNVMMQQAKKYYTSLLIQTDGYIWLLQTIKPDKENIMFIVFYYHRNNH